MPKTIALVLVTMLLLTACGGSGSTSPKPTAIASATTAETSPVASSRPPATPGASTHTLRHGALERSYRLYVPAAVAASGAKVPLVVALHGGLGTPEQFAAASRFESLADAEHFIVVFPAGVERTWNGGACCRPATVLSVDDTGFLAALIEQLQAALPIDSGRVLVTGHSNGAIMAFRLACERPDVVDAVVPVAGSIEIDRCQPSRPVPLLDIHGDADRNHPLEGGQGDRSVANVDFRSTAATMAAWSAAMGCAEPPLTRTEGALTTSAWQGCRDGVRTELLVIAGADHPWPGGASIGVSGGRPSQALDASAAAYRFLLDVTK